MYWGGSRLLNAQFCASRDATPTEKTDARASRDGRGKGKENGKSREVRPCRPASVEGIRERGKVKTALPPYILSGEPNIKELQTQRGDRLDDSNIGSQGGNKSLKKKRVEVTRRRNIP